MLSHMNSFTLSSSCFRILTSITAFFLIGQQLFAGIVAPNSSLEKLADGFAFTEGPVRDAQGNVFFTDQPNDRILKWSAETGEVTEWMKPAGRSNGLDIDAKGNLIACADEQNQLWKISPDKEVEILVVDVKGKLLNGPNDCWVDPQGGIYFTDPLYKRPWWDRDPVSQLDGRHVYYLTHDRKKLLKVADGFEQPNGIIGSPDGKKLWVADIGAGVTYEFAISSPGMLTGQSVFCEMGSDGMTLDEDGNLYLTGNGVTVFNRRGEQIHHVDVPEGWTANVTFGGKHRNLLFITASSAIYGLEMKVKGAD